MLGTPGKSQQVPSCEGGSGARTAASSSLGVFNLPGMLSGMLTSDVVLGEPA